MIHVLIVDDDGEAARSLRALIADAERLTVALAGSLLEARRLIVMQRPDLLLLDLRLPDGSGMELLSDPTLLAETEVVLITGHASIETSIEALRLGAADYLVKPIKEAQLRAVLSRFMRPARLQAEIGELNADLAASGHFGPLWGLSAPMKRVYAQISKVAVTSVPVFVCGESGTGKELAAQMVHELSRRRKKAFLAVNCGAISPNLIESEIFGHEKGSFTGAERQHLGFFERASGGTLFLDEITEMPLALQVKLLRVLETGRFMRVGSMTQIEADVRLIAASNRRLHEAVAAGRLREDLLYRLNVFPIEMPPLRERLSDVPLLAQHFLAEIGAREGGTKRFTPEALELIAAFDWPGNVRQLRNAVQRAYVMSSGETIATQWLLPGPLPPTPTPPSEAAAEALPVGSAEPSGDVLSLPIGSSLADVERALIVATLRHCDHHKERAAAMLGISLKTLYNRLKDYAAERGVGAAAPAIDGS